MEGREKWRVKEVFNFIYFDYFLYHFKFFLKNQNNFNDSKNIN